MGPTSFFRITGDILCLCRLGDIAILFSCLETANREFIKKKSSELNSRISTSYFLIYQSYLAFYIRSPSTLFNLLFFLSRWHF